MTELEKRLGELYNRVKQGEKRLYYYFTADHNNPNDVGEIFTAADSNIFNPKRDMYGCFGGLPSRMTKKEFVKEQGGF